MCIEKCKHGSGRGLHKPTLEIGKGGAFLLYYVGNGMMIHCGDVRPDRAKVEVDERGID